MQRIDQGQAVSVLLVQSIQTFTGNQKRGDRPAIVSKPDPAQLCTLAQKECPSKNIRGLKAVSIQSAHLLPGLDFWGKMR